MNSENDKIILNSKRLILKYFILGYSSYCLTSFILYSTYCYIDGKNALIKARYHNNKLNYTDEFNIIKEEIFRNSNANVLSAITFPYSLGIMIILKLNSKDKRN
jgi:hypothetical protein